MLLSKSSLEAGHPPEATLLVEATSPRANVTYPVKLRVQRGATSEPSLDEAAVVIEVWAEQRSLADTIAAFKDVFPDKVSLHTS